MRMHCTCSLNRFQFKPSVLFRCTNIHPKPSSIRSSILATMSTVSTESAVASDQNGSTNDAQKPLQVTPSSLIIFFLFTWMISILGFCSIRCFCFLVAFLWNWVWHIHVLDYISHFFSGSCLDCRFCFPFAFTYDWLSRDTVSANWEILICWVSSEMDFQLLNTRTRVMVLIDLKPLNSIIFWCLEMD